MATQTKQREAPSSSNGRPPEKRVAYGAALGHPADVEPFADPRKPPKQRR